MSRGSRRERQRARILARDGYRCVYCGRVLPPEELTLDHVEPQVKGGDWSEGNLVTACGPCNAEKADSVAWAYLADRPAARATFLRLATGVWPRLRRAVEEAADRESPPGR